MKKSIVGLLISAALLGGCTTYSEAPVAVNPISTNQLKLQAASHWQLIGDHAAQRLITVLPKNTPIHIVQSDNSSAFEKAFNDQLVGKLTAVGYQVMRSPNAPGALHVEVSATPLVFSKDRLQGRFVGSATMLTSGLWLLSDIYSNVSPGAAMVSAGVAVDAYRWFSSEYASGATPRTELLVSVSVFDSQRYYARINDAYYTNDDNWGLYAKNAVLPVKGVR